MLVSYKDATHCYYCEISFNSYRFSHKTREHVIPRIMGGGSGAKNIVPACYFCNQLKGSYSLDDFFNLVMIRSFRQLAENEGRDLNKILENIAKLKVRVNNGEDLIFIPPPNPPKQKVKKQPSKNQIVNPQFDSLRIIKSYDWFKKCKFSSEHSEVMFAETVRIVQQSKKRKLTQMEGHELYKKLRGVDNTPSPNFHEDAPENKIATIN